MDDARHCAEKNRPLGCSDPAACIAVHAPGWRGSKQTCAIFPGMGFFRLRFVLEFV